MASVDVKDIDKGAEALPEMTKGGHKGALLMATTQYYHEH